MSARLLLSLNQLAEHLVREVNRANSTALVAQAELREATPEFQGVHWSPPTLAVDECQFTLYLAPTRPTRIVRVWGWIVRFFWGPSAASPDIRYQLVPSAKVQIAARIHAVREGTRLTITDIESEPPRPDLATIEIQSKKGSAS